MRELWSNEMFAKISQVHLVQLINMRNLRSIDSHELGALNPLKMWSQNDEFHLQEKFTQALLTHTSIHSN